MRSNRRGSSFSAIRIASRSAPPSPASTSTSVSTRSLRTGRRRFPFPHYPDARMTSPETPRSLTRIVVRGAGLAGAGHILTQVISLVAYLALARLATPHEFGQLAAGSIVVGAGLLVSEAGMLAAVVQRRDRVEEAASTALVATVLGGILLSLV